MYFMEMKARSVFDKPLPIDAVLPAIKAALATQKCAVLEAPPGAGKTTRVPLVLLDAAWLDGYKILMLEPRRLAARAAAYRLAEQLGQRVGDTVGYRMRQDTRVSERTRIEVVTEGILTRMLLDDPSLEGVGLVIFDEFHERSLTADLGLALCRQTQEIFRSDLKLLIMSATLDAGALAVHLDQAPVVRSEGKMYPIETKYLGHTIRGTFIEPMVAGAILQAINETAGDVLVFLPGAAEIRRTAEKLTGMLPDSVMVHPLFGNLTRKDQDRALAPALPGTRKVVLATSIAETSLTIDGVRTVIDSGQMRVPRFDPRICMTRLETVTVTLDAADQRRGRAGRQAPGVCYRLWSESEQYHLRAARTPEILEADLAPLALTLAAWGVADPIELSWLDQPPQRAYDAARALLFDLGAIDAEGRLTDTGGQMANLPTHPRLAHMLLEANAMGHGALAADLTALLEERDILTRSSVPASADLRLRLELMAKGRKGNHPGHSWHHHQIKQGGFKRVQQTAGMWRKHLHLPKSSSTDPGAAGLVLALAYPDRIAQNTGVSGRFRLRDGQYATLDADDALAEMPFLVIANLDGRPDGARIFLAAPIELQEIENLFADRGMWVDEVDWDRANERVRLRKIQKLGVLVLAEKPLMDVDQDTINGVLLGEVANRGLHVLNWTKEATRLRDRLRFMHHLDSSWPDASDEALSASLQKWLAPFVFDARRLEDLKRVNLQPALASLLSWEQLRALDHMAPEHMEVPSGSSIALDYSDPSQPVLAVRLQEVFGLSETPRIANGEVPLTMHLLSPAQRPVQVTRDLASFWQHTYFEVRKDMRGRYPKHYWPEDPTQAVATRRVKGPGSG